MPPFSFVPNASHPNRPKNSFKVENTANDHQSHKYRYLSIILALSDGQPCNALDISDSFSMIQSFHRIMSINCPIRHKEEQLQ